MNKSQAIKKLRESKENLELELITQEQYDEIKEKLKPIILGKDFETYKEKNNQEEKIEEEPMPILPPANFYSSDNSNKVLSPLGQWSWSGSEWVSTLDLNQVNPEKEFDLVQDSGMNDDKLSTKKEKSSKWVYIGMAFIFFWLIGAFLIPTNSSSNSSRSMVSSTHYCLWCGDKYNGRGYTTLMRVVNRVDRDDSPLNSYCSRKCATAKLRNN